MSDKKMEQLLSEIRNNQKIIRDLSKQVECIEENERMSRCPTEDDLLYYYKRYYGGIEGHITAQGIVNVIQYILTKYIDTALNRINVEEQDSTDIASLLIRDRKQLTRPGRDE
jgi:hypothetical protein